jgi:hypothetical protein
MYHTSTQGENFMVNALDLTDVLDRIVDEQETTFAGEMAGDARNDRAGQTATVRSGAPSWFTCSR